MCYYFLFYQVNLQQTSPLYSPVCPRDNVVLTCTVTSTIIQWINPLDNTNSASFSVMAIPGTNTTIGNFTVVFVSSISNVITSEARLYNVSSHHNGSSIICNNVVMNVRNQIDVIVSRKYYIFYYINYNLIILYRYIVKSTKCHFLTNKFIISNITLVYATGEWTLCNQLLC